MQTSQLKFHKVNLHVLSPIHIGTDQELDPFSYVIRDNNLVLIDLIKWMESYPEKEKLHRMIETDNFAEIRTFIAENIETENVTLGTIPVESKGLVRTYERVVKAKDPRNQLLIDGMTRNKISQVAYIPGSSIKGAIRTAIANHFVATAGVTSKNKNKTFKPAFEPDYNEKIFGRIHEDPMRNLKLSDVSLDNFGSLIVEAEEYSLKEEKSKTPKGYKEVSVNLCQSGKPVVYPLRLSMKPFPLHGQKVDVPFVIDALYRFYVSNYKNEYNKFYSSNQAENIRREIAPINLEIANLRTNETLIRVGHFSHVECITLEHVREPQTRVIKGRRMPYGTTRTLANGLYPFGWAKLEFTELESKPRSESEWPFSLEEIKKAVESKKRAVESAKKATQEAQAIQMQEQAQRLAEEKRKAEFERMSPEERDIALVNDPETNEEKVVEIFNGIDGFSEDTREKLAKAFKDRWIVLDKWEGKQSKKQKTKIQKIKQLLERG